MATSHGFHRLALSLLVLLLAGIIAFAPPASSADVWSFFNKDKITLICSGTVFAKDPPTRSWKTGDQSVVIDFDRKIVEESLSVDLLGDISITSVTTASVYLGGTTLVGPHHVNGSINRLTGEAWISTEKEEFQGTCKPAKPLF